MNEPGDETQMIAALERLITTMEQDGIDTASMRDFFNVGEWLLSFEGAYFQAASPKMQSISSTKDYIMIESYFKDYLSEA